MCKRQRDTGAALGHLLIERIFGCVKRMRWTVVTVYAVHQTDLTSYRRFDASRGKFGDSTVGVGLPDPGDCLVARIG